MNQKTTTLVNPNRSTEDLARIEDLKSDADTFPEFSNRDGSKEAAVYQLTMVRVAHAISETNFRGIAEMIANEMRVWKTPTSQFAFFAAPHIPLLNLTHGVAKKYCGEKVMLRSSHFFSEPKNDKYTIAKDSEVKNLKYEVILGHSRFTWDKVEAHKDIERRVESTLTEVLRVLPNIVIVLGPIAFDVLYESLEKRKRRSNEKIKKLVVMVENFRKEDNKWKRVPKNAVNSISIPLIK
uniref:Uncharacterized protein n=1 Tax=Caenorhabditis japonica TaxID=281687 RepID=A0A8R1E1N6_CAEJA